MPPMLAPIITLFWESLMVSTRQIRVWEGDEGCGFREKVERLEGVVMMKVR